MAKSQHPRIGDLLRSRDLITEEELAQALLEQKATGERLGDILVSRGILTDADLIEVISERLGIPKISIEGFATDPEVIHTIPLRIAKKHSVVALFKIHDTLTVAMADPLDMVAIDEIRYQTGLRVNRVVATPEDIKTAIERFYSVAENVDRVIGDSTARTAAVAAEGGGDEGPVIQLVDVLLTEAIKQRSSDIHIEPMEGALRVRFRVDGLLREEAQPPAHLHASITSRIKVMAGMDVSQKRLPQDGRFAMPGDGEQVDLRVSTIPTIHGEKVVIRILGRQGKSLSMDALGLAPAHQSILKSQLRVPEGMILISGPTSSGKTTTLYSALNEVTSPEKNIVTVEDPVEFALPFVNQVQINEKAGLDFPLCLRAFLRQNPDVIMVGEIRDSQTGQIATRAAMTGHLVLSTIHTIDAASAPHRLMDIGVEPFLVATALRAVVAQRLVRRLCRQCATSITPSAALREQMGFNMLSDAGEWRAAAGCPECRGSGYKGLIGVYEVMLIDEEIRRLIGEGASAALMRDHLHATGFADMRANARDLVESGTTTAEEIMRAVPQRAGALEAIV